MKGTPPDLLHAAGNIHADARIVVRKDFIADGRHRNPSCSEGITTSAVMPLSPRTRASLPLLTMTKSPVCDASGGRTAAEQLGMDGAVHGDQVIFCIPGPIDRFGAGAAHEKQRRDQDQIALHQQHHLHAPCVRHAGTSILSLSCAATSVNTPRHKRPPRTSLRGAARGYSVSHQSHSAALVPAMRPQVKHIMMEVPEAGYS